MDAFLQAHIAQHKNTQTYGHTYIYMCLFIIEKQLKVN